MDQSNQERDPAPAGSPRRKKAPLDLDTALYLQSQASYVQEPNQRVSPSSASSNQSVASTTTRTTNQFATNHQQQQHQQQTAQQNNNFLHNTPKGGFQQVPQHHYYYNYNNNNNNSISVDYIDCLSNDDLRPPLSFGGAHSSTQMCTKKYPRFHRNRVEPSGAAMAAAESISEPTNLNTTGDATGDSNSSIITSANESNGYSNGAQQGAAAAATTSSSSVLYPISVGDVKKRTYFIGSLGQDSLLGHEELSRYFPNNRVSIFVCTWNQNRKRASMNLGDLLLPDQLVYMADIYAIGIQEAFSSQGDYLREWEIELQTTLGPNHVLLHSCSLGTLHLSLFVRRDLIWFCSVPEESVYNSRSMPTNMIKTKGAVSIAFRFFGTSFMFTNCHFPAHENKLKDRIDEYQRIIQSIDLPKNLKLLKPRYLSNDSTARFDCVFFMGDLNFRLEQRTFDETISILEDIFQQKDPSYESLTQHDELMKVMESGQAFHGFDESSIKFPPTYKFLAQTNKYDKQTKRVPSYTDRILFRSKRQRHIQCLVYDWLPQMLSSDHKPVYSLFDVLIRPGREQNMVSSLNAGLFQRTIYLEALKRRAETDPDALRDGEVGGSLICSIS